MEEQYENFVNDFNQCFYDIKKQKEISDIIFLCIGTNRMTGDSFGPLVGYHLQELFRSINTTNIAILGDLENPINVTNLENTLQNIQKNYENPCIVVIDSALSRKEDIGRIMISKEKMNLGKGLNKKIVAIGDISIKGVVAKNLKVPKYNLIILQNTPLNIVMNLARLTANGIYDVIKYA